MARTLIISALQVFPPLSGGNRRTAMLAEGLAAHGHAVRVLSVIGRKADMLSGKGAADAAVGPALTEHVLRPRLTWLLAMVAYRFGLPPFWAQWALARGPRRLKADCAWAEVVIFDFPFVAFTFDRAGKTVVLNTHNIEARLFGGSPWRERHLVPRVARLEQAAVAQADLVCCSSREETDAFSSAAPGKRCVLVPNCVDQKRFHDLAPLRQGLRAELGLAPSTRVLFFPASAYGPNREGFEYLHAFAESQGALLDRLDLVFLVTGSVTKTPLRAGRLIATGPVPRIEPYFAAADWGVNPIFQGSGTSVKVAEMIAAGLPLLTTPIGARGFDLEAGVDAVVFTRDTFAGQLAALPRAAEQLAALARGARTKNTRYLEPDAAVLPLARLLGGAAGDDSSARDHLAM